MMEALGAILAGGASSRMGENKAMVEIAGRSMSAWTADALTTALTDSSRRVVLGSTPISGIPNLEDRPGDGPLSGLAAVADAADLLGFTPRAVLVVAVDHPWVRPDTLGALLSRYDGVPVVPVHHDIRQVTCAVYPMSIVAAASDAATTGMGFQALLDEMVIDDVTPDIWATWGEDGRSWFSVDAPQDLARGLDRYGPPG